MALSPQKSLIYTRRLESSMHQPPVLPSPKRRRFEIIDTEVQAARPSKPAADHRPFNIFTALLKNPELLFEFANHLPTDDLVSLYAISKEFHFLANQRLTALILGHADTRAPESSHTFPFTCYRSLCMQDPNQTQLEGTHGLIRSIPSFRWLRMVHFREQVVDEILGHLYGTGHRLPRRVSLVLKKLWFTLDFSDNVRRMALVHNEHYWPSTDLFLATMFLVKLDMRLNDPLTGSGHLGLRRLLLNQRSLSTLARVLQRTAMQRDLDMVRMMVLYNYEPRTNTGEHIFGIHPRHAGKLQYEGWGTRRTKFIPIDEVIGREGLKRGLQMHHFYIDMMLFGYVNKFKFEDMDDPPPGVFAAQDYVSKSCNGKSSNSRSERAFDSEEATSRAGSNNSDMDSTASGES